MRPKLREQAEARRMREEGASLREIAFALGVSLSSVSLWVRDVSLPEDAGDDSGQSPPAPDPDASVLLTDPVEPERPCSRCERVLPASLFNRHPTGRQWWCRECYREYFRQRGQLHRDQSAAAKERRRQVALRFVADYKRTHPCVDCGETAPAILEFDHVGSKRGDISVLAAAGISLEALESEISQCEVVCVNCHRRRTGRRAGWRRAAPKWWETPPPKRYETARNMAVAYNHLELSGCVDCGEADLCVLDFDHVGPKTGNVIDLAREGASLDRLYREIENCEVRCANCHRSRTAEQRAEGAKTAG